MTKRRAVVLCEDRAHWHFIRGYLKERGWNPRQITSRVSPHGRGSAEQWVRKKYVEELTAHRSKGGENIALIVMVDGDKKTVQERIGQLEHSPLMQKAGTQPRQPQERIAIFVPCRNLETWLAYLDGATVNEKSDYRTYKRGASRAKPAAALAAQCIESGKPGDAPPSLGAACDEWLRIG